MQIQGPAEAMPLNVVGRVCECLARNGQHLNISPKMSCGVLEYDTVMLQNHIPMAVIKDFYVIQRGIICAGPCICV